ncbi:MAG: hypothetical protein AB7H71_14760 [Alphaproteobacteria bacterium]
MKRVAAVALIALSLAGCDGNGGGAPPAPPSASEPAAASVAPASAEPGLPAPVAGTPRAQLRVGFGGLVDTIEVSAVEYLPLREAMLVAPDGTIVPATYIAVGDNPRLQTGQWSMAQRWDDLGTQDNALAALALHSAQAGAALYSSRQLLAMVSRADIPVPDPVAYRRDWRDWRIRLTFGTPPAELETRVIAAPEPPPG